jgi:hypothetical protein
VIGAAAGFFGEVKTVPLGELDCQGIHQHFGRVGFAPMTTGGL